MSDAWEILTANATDTTDAWAALNSQEGGGAVPGEPITELVFALSGVSQITGVLTPANITGNMSAANTAGVIQNNPLTGLISTPVLTGLIEVEEI